MTKSNGRQPAPRRDYIPVTVPFAAGAVVCYVIHVLNTRRLAERPELRAAQ